MKKGIVRIIPRLDVKGPNLIKGIQFDGYRVVGTPEYFANLYYHEGADELFFQDTVASLYRRNSLLEIISKTASKVFIPITVAGGLCSVEDIRAVLRAGADKVAINTAAVENPKLIQEAARVFGSQCIVSSIETYRKSNGEYRVWVDYGRQPTHLNAMDWAKQVVDLGAGEIILTSINQEGTGRGFDLELIQKISESVPIPVIACGGAGQPAHLIQAIREGKADAVSVASAFHYKYMDAYPSYDQFSASKALRMGRHLVLGNWDFLSFVYCGQRAIPVGPFSIQEAKTAVTLLDYGLGNLFNLRMALESLDTKVKTVHSANDVLAANQLILPGVGAFEHGIKNLRERGLIQALKDYSARGRPLLGICLGMQLLTSVSYENGEWEGLGLIDGQVTPIQPGSGESKVKVPHMTWNGIDPVESIKSWRSTLLRDIPAGAPMYFVHSYKVQVNSPDDCLAKTEYGLNSFHSVIRKKNVIGVQFHPERSGTFGLKLLDNFLKGDL